MPTRLDRVGIFYGHDIRFVATFTEFLASLTQFVATSIGFVATSVIRHTFRENPTTIRRSSTTETSPIPSSSQQ